MLFFDMIIFSAFICEKQRTMTALKRIFRHNSMSCAHMSFEPERVANALPTDFTFRTFVDVILMRFQSMWSTKGTVTFIALFWSVFLMLHFDVFFQIIAP